MNGIQSNVIRIQKESLKLEQEIIELKSNTPNIKAEDNILDVLMEDAEKTRKDCAKVSEKLDEYAVVHSYLEMVVSKSR